MNKVNITVIFLYDKVIFKILKKKKKKKKKKKFFKKK